MKKNAKESVKNEEKKSKISKLVEYFVIFFHAVVRHKIWLYSNTKTTEAFFLLKFMIVGVLLPRFISQVKCILVQNYKTDTDTNETNVNLKGVSNL